MERGYFSLTVCFEDPFWIGVFQREESGGLSACKVTFGAEPRDFEVWELVLNAFWTLEFSPEVEAESVHRRVNAKRARRQAAALTEACGMGTKAQRALQLQHEARKTAGQTAGRQRDEAEAERRFCLRQTKKKEKHRGH